MELYDAIGPGYRQLRRPDPRIAARILRALGDASDVVNVGAGAGSYEPRDRRVVAVEPSETMIRQRDPGTAPAVRASAARLPFGDDSFGAALAVLTVHHWTDRARGLGELRRVARDRVVLLTWDPSAPGFWLTEYFPEILDIDRRIFPPFSELRRHVGRISVADVPVPHDCTDGFLGASWQRPHVYLNPDVRRAISTFSRLRDPESGLTRLRHDLESGEWDRRYGHLRAETALDLGYRLVVTGPPRAAARRDRPGRLLHGVTSPHVCRLRPEDAEAYVTLRQEMLHESPHAFLASPVDDFASEADRVRERLAAGPDNVTFGAFDPELAGAAGLFRESHEKARHKAHIWGMFVQPRLRRQGVARRLMEAVLAHARALDGVTQVHLSVSESAPEARALYESLGFRAWGTEPRALLLGEHYLDEIHLALLLDAEDSAP